MIRLYKTMPTLFLIWSSLSTFNPCYSSGEGQPSDPNRDVYLTSTIPWKCDTIENCEKPSLDQYMTLSQIENYLHHLDRKYNFADVSLVNLTDETEPKSQTFDGNDIWMLHIKSKGNNRLYRKKVWVEAGIHAREWISVAVAINLVHKILVEAPQMREGVEYFVIPVANPDGYAFTMADPANRFWRKNRRDNGNSSCKGVDLNRNWDNHWGETNSYADKCSIQYRGEFPFSEVETIALAKELRKQMPDLLIAFHSYGQQLFYPYAYTPKPLEPSKAVPLEELGHIFADGVGSTTGDVYAVMQAGIGDPRSGSTDDYAYDALEIGYVYTLELPPVYPDPTNTTFALPPSQIRKTFEGVSKGIELMVDRLKNVSSFSRGTSHQKDLHTFAMFFFTACSLLYYFGQIFSL